MAFEAVVIEARQLACDRGGRRVFCELNFKAEPGRLVELTGANGSGKSTLLRLIAGLLAPSEGTLAVMRGGETLDDDTPPSSLVHYLGHLDALKPALTARENLTYAARLNGAIGEIATALETARLAPLADTPVSYFSAGQKRRLALARCWMLQRTVWLLDEPYAALDADGRVLAREMIAGHLNNGGTVIAATHDVIDTGAQRLALGGRA
jgi:heme exporter protein A